MQAVLSWPYRLSQETAGTNELQAWRKPNSNVGPLNTVIDKVMHMVLDLPVSDDAEAVAISEVIQPRTRKRK